MCTFHAYYDMCDVQSEERLAITRHIIHGQSLPVRQRLQIPNMHQDQAFGQLVHTEYETQGKTIHNHTVPMAIKCRKPYNWLFLEPNWIILIYGSMASNSSGCCRRVSSVSGKALSLPVTSSPTMSTIYFPVLSCLALFNCDNSRYTRFSEQMAVNSYLHYFSSAMLFDRPMSQSLNDRW